MLRLTRSAEEFHLGHCPALDGLRGFAVLVVMFGHSNLLGAGADLQHPHDAFDRPLLGAYLGVVLFFALSGFLITTLLLEEHRSNGRIRLGAFYLRRALRVLPALALMLAACCVYAACAVEPGNARLIFRAVLLSCCWASNFYWVIPGLSLGMLTHTWSLCLEEQFYLIWPLMLGVLLRFRLGGSWLFGLLAFGAVASAMFRFAVWHWGEVTGYHIASASLPARADALLAGAAAAAALHYFGVPQWNTAHAVLRGAAWAAALLLLGLLRWCGPGSHLFYGVYAAAGLASAILIAGIVAAAPRYLDAALSFGLLAWVGRISYGLYLWHIPVICTLPLVLAELFHQDLGGPTVGNVVAWCLTFGLAAGSYYLIEQPCRRFRSSFRALRIQASAEVGCKAA